MKTRRGRGQRRSRRLKNKNLDSATRKALYHIKMNRESYGHRVAEVLPDLVANYRRSQERYDSQRFS